MFERIIVGIKSCSWHALKIFDNLPLLGGVSDWYLPIWTSCTKIRCYPRPAKRHPHFVIQFVVFDRPFENRVALFEQVPWDDKVGKLNPNLVELIRWVGHDFGTRRWVALCYSAEEMKIIYNIRDLLRCSLLSEFTVFMVKKWYIKNNELGLSLFKNFKK